MRNMTRCTDTGSREATCSSLKLGPRTRFEERYPLVRRRTTSRVMNLSTAWRHRTVRVDERDECRQLRRRKSDRGHLRLVGCASDRRIEQKPSQVVRFIAL